MDEVAARGPFRVAVAGPADELADAGFEVLTRCQRLLGRRNDASRGPLFDRLLDRHRALHDLDRPLVRADYDHALDVWQWTLRLWPAAGLAVQAAALYHDVERLESEADARREQRTTDYQAFKDAHARRSAAIAEAELRMAGFGRSTRKRAARLIAGHDRAPGQGTDREALLPGDPEPALLADADALSFFSFNSAGYLAYFGRDATRRKVAWTLDRMSPGARRRLARLRLGPEVEALLAEALAPPARRLGGSARAGAG